MVKVQEKNTHILPQLNNHLSLSETVVGLLLLSKQSPTQFSPDHFSGEYAKVVKDIKLGLSLDEIMLKYLKSANLIQSALYAGQSVNGLGEQLDWSELISRKYSDELIISDTELLQKHLRNGDRDKAGELLRRLNASFTNSQRLRSVLASDINVDDYTTLIPSGSLAWDTHLGGIPSVGLVILAGLWSSGKTTSIIGFVDNYLQNYPDQEVLFVTLEDMNEGWKKRAQQLIKRPKNFWDRIHVMEFAGNPEEIIEEASRFENVTLIITDYVDYLANERDVNSFEKIYKTFSTGAKSLAIGNKYRKMCVIALAQFGKTLYRGGVPTESALPYTGQTYAYELIMLYNPNTDFYADNHDNPYTLPEVPGKAYITCWKIKAEKVHGDDFPGAILLPWTNTHGFEWNEKGEWMSLASNTKRTVKARK